MNEHMNPKSEPTRSPTQDEGGSALARLWERLGQTGLAELVLRFGAHALVVGMALLVIVGMRGLVLREPEYSQEQLQATAEALAAPTLNVPTRAPGDYAVDADLPSYTAPQADYSSGIPRLARLDTTIPNRARVEVSTYVVQQGDNLFDIAEKFGLRPETILWGNYDVLQDNPRLLQTGQVLNILPVDGTYYQYNEGEKLSTVAEFFGVTAEEIVNWPGNHLDSYEIDIENPDIPDGTWLIVPGGERELRDWGPPAITRENPAAAAYYGPGHCGDIYEGAVGTGTFIFPTVQHRLSGYDYSNIHPALDFAGNEGDPIYATDSGVVVYAGESNYGYGILVVIDHGNGWQSAYAHLSSIAVFCGQNVSQGEVVAALGNTGNSTGPHLHFELRSEQWGKVNPWNFLQ